MVLFHFKQGLLCYKIIHVMIVKHLRVVSLWCSCLPLLWMVFYVKGGTHMYITW